MYRIHEPAELTQPTSVVTSTYREAIADPGVRLVASRGQGVIDIAIEDGEFWLVNCYIPPHDSAGRFFQHEPRRKRKLLLNKQEILKLGREIKESGYTLVPLSLYFKDGRAKVEIALAKGKKEYDKRQTLREQQDTREAARAMSTKGKDW